MLLLLFPSPSSNQDYHTNSTQDHAGPDTTTSQLTRIISKNPIKDFTGNFLRTAHKPNVYTVKLSQAINDTFHGGRCVAQTQPVVITQNTPPSSKLQKSAAISPLTNQNTQPTVLYTPANQNTLSDGFSQRTAIVSLLGRKVTDTLRWAATVALANQNNKSQGHSPLNLTNELSHKLHKNLSYGSAGTTRAH